MQRVLEYIVFFVVVVLLQALLFDNLLLSGLIVPLYYISFVVLLPVKMSKLGLLVVGTLLGVVMDVSMGTAGLNTVATAAVAYLRPLAMNISMGKDTAHESIPFGGAITPISFMLYATLLVVAHSALFFGLESLGSHPLFTIGKIILSSVVTVILTIFTARLFRKLVS